MKHFIVSAALAAAFSIGGAATAATTVVFQEDFAGDLATAGNISVLNFNNFAQFDATDGTVDLIRSGDFSIDCLGAACVDLDGSNRNAGFLASNVLSFVAGVRYSLSFALSGNQRNNNAESGTFGVTNGIFTGNFSAAGSTFTTFTSEFRVASDTTATIFFSDNGNDNVGAILDSASLTAAIPLPASVLMLLGGLGGLGVMRRSKKTA